MTTTAEPDWKRLYVAKCLDGDEFSFHVSRLAWERSEHRGVEMRQRPNGSWDGWINEDFPSVSGTDLGKGM